MIEDDGVFSEIQKIAVKKDNVFEEVIFTKRHRVSSINKAVENNTKLDQSSTKSKIKHEDPRGESDHREVLFNPFEHISELASQLSIGTMAACFLFIALSCLSCTNEFILKV